MSVCLCVCVSVCVVNSACVRACIVPSTIVRRRIPVLGDFGVQKCHFFLILVESTIPHWISGGATDSLLRHKEVQVAWTPELQYLAGLLPQKG